MQKYRAFSLCSVIFLLFSSSLFASSFNGSRKQVSVVVDKLESVKKESKLHVFLLHGIKGNKETFGDLPAILEETYQNKLKTSYLTYPTNPNKKTDVVEKSLNASNFAHVVYTKMINYFVENGFDSSSNYSFVSHSQGGVVALKFIQYCVEKMKCNYEKGLEYIRAAQEESVEVYEKNLEQKKSTKLAGKLKFVMTLGAPFWGSPLASRVSDFPLFKSLFKKQFPEKQLESLASGSLNLTLNRKYLLGNLYQDEQWSSPIKSDVRFYNLSGYVNLKEIKPQGIIQAIVKGLSLVFYRKTSETDIAVEVSDARIDFHYFIEKTNPENQDQLDIFQGTTNLSQNYTPLQLSHIHIPLFKQSGIFNLVDIDSKNKDQYSSWAYMKSIFDQEFGNEGKVFSEEEIAKVRTFKVEVKTELPIGYHRKLPIKKSSFQLKAAPGYEDEFQYLSATNTIFNKFSGMNTKHDDQKVKNYQTFYHQGKLVKGNHMRASEITHSSSVPKYKIDYTLDIPGWEKKEFRLNVSPTFSSYAELIMKPYLPLKKREKNFYLNDFQSYLVNVLYYDGRDMIVTTIEDAMGERPYTKLKFYSSLKELKEELSKTEEDLEKRLATTCFEGKMGAIVKGTHENKAFELPTSQNDEETYSLEEGEKVTVLGRVSTGNEGSLPGVQMEAPTDRYLVTSLNIRKNDRINNLEKAEQGKGLRWVNVKDVDIIKSVRCQMRSSYQKTHGPKSKTFKSRKQTTIKSQEFKQFYK
ncbi:MAG: hypothetical protein ACPGJV_07630 [Bacteriovoracaceae bacterium]